MSSGQYIKIGGLQVHKALKQCVEADIAPGTGVAPAAFWASMEKVLRKFAPENESLLRKRDAMQGLIDAYILGNAGKPWDQSAYAAYLGRIGYLVPEGADFALETTNVDPEIASTPGPQLVVPVDNARYALNAANARWGSLLDAFYGTDAGPPESPGLEKGSSYNPARGAKVFELAHAFLDEHFALAGGAKYGEAAKFQLAGKALEVQLASGKKVGLAQPAKFVGFLSTPAGASGAAGLSSVLLKNNGLHAEIQVDAASPVGQTHQAGVKDIVIESAITAIADCEDSVAAVDAEDKARVYRHWAGLMKGTLEEKFSKGSKTMTRRLNDDKTFTDAATGGALVLPGRVVLLVRNVGIHLYSDAIKMADSGQLVPETLLDAMVTSLAAMHDLKLRRNSRAGSVYIVKPKLHGVEEVDYTVRMFSMVEQELGIPANALKMGIMDEERRTSVNLKECMRAAKQRCIFVNTGFLDRTGDEIHTSFRLGPVMPKGDIKGAIWRTAYEKYNVDVAIEAGILGKGQIGKGMYDQPENMKDMLATKVSHPKEGATVAWVPSPTAATLHAIHYHMVDVLAVQEQLKAGGRRATVGDILIPPMLGAKTLTKAQIDHEVRDNLQTLVAYVARWVQLGVGCSAVPDIDNIKRMEDRATLRISSQIVGNWLHHGLVSGEEVIAIAKEMAQLVDKQNAGQAGYEPMAPAYTSNAFQCALEMIFDAKACPNGLTEGTLTKYRRAEKLRRSTSKL